MISTDFSEMYRMTLFIVGTANLVMAITLLLMYVVGKYQNTHFQQGVCFLAAAMMLMTCINYMELFMPINEAFLPHSQSYVVLAASIELFLLLYSVVLVLDPDFAFRRKIRYELLLILLFVVPSLVIEAEGVVRSLLFGLAILFYSCKFVYSLYVYRKAYRKAQSGLRNFYSEEKDKIIRWVNTVFYLLVLIGTTSLLVPFANYKVLTCYNIFLFFAYLYIYVEVLRHEPLMHAQGRALVPSAAGQELPAETSGSGNFEAQVPRNSFLANKSSLLNTWLADRAYCRSGITIEEVAVDLNTNRTTFSLFLNSELGQSFYEWISFLRVEEAKRLLIQNPTTPVLDIAIQVGIDDRSNFDKAFKRVVGLSPVAYRKSCLASSEASSK